MASELFMGQNPQHQPSKAPKASFKGVSLPLSARIKFLSNQVMDGLPLCKGEWGKNKYL